MNERILIIGAGGGIASALLALATHDTRTQQLHVISRRPPEVAPAQNVNWRVVNSQDETAISNFCDQCVRDKITFTRIICCVGILHNDDVQPEKRLEQISKQQLETYMLVNFITPSLWVKHAVKLLAPKCLTSFTVLSARVGSISDNQLGGWYGYRASKAALNMMLKTAQVEYRRRLPESVLVAYHPGTVDTQLSKPFQANVKPEKLFTPEFTAQALWRELDTLSVEKAPYYIDWQGKTISW